MNFTYITYKLGGPMIDCFDIDKQVNSLINPDYGDSAGRLISVFVRDGYVYGTFERVRSN